MSEDNKGTILIVDDNRNNLMVLSVLLNKHQYEVISANSGEKCLELLRKRKPELILLDIMMPGLNGFETCEKIQQSEEIRDIPIIFLTAMDSLEYKLTGFKVGGKDFITKPFEESEVLARVDTHIELYRLQNKLKKTANEMEQFAYMAAHDLKSPANTIEGFCNLLETGNAQSNPEVIAMMGKSASRLRTLVDGLLDLADSNKSFDENEQTDLNEVFEDLLFEFETKIESTSTTITKDNLPTVQGNKEQLRILFRNLIGNAIKYAKKDTPPFIQITSSSDQNIVTLKITDNGEGFLQKEDGDIFRPFIRLHSGNVEGHGLGLATCYKIIQKLKGSISAESQPGEGSTFILKLNSL